MFSESQVRSPLASTPSSVIGAPADQAENYRVRLLLMARLRDMMKSRNLTQVQAASWFRVSQCRVSHLVNNRANRFTTDTLINMLANAGVHVRVAFWSEGPTAERVRAPGRRETWPAAHSPAALADRSR